MRNSKLLSLLLVASLLIFSGCLAEPVPVTEEGGAAAGEAGPQEMEQVKAEAGVGKQGQIIGDKEGVLVTPVKALFKVKQQAAFLKVDYALKLYDAEHGYKPKTEEEFMAKIIEFNKIELPELPEGQKYFWDPEAGELMVERPRS